MFTGLKEVESDYRFQYFNVSKNGFKQLPKHKQGYVTREKRILELYSQYEEKNITEDAFLNSIANLFIPQNVFELVEEVSNKIENGDEDNNTRQEDELINDAAEVIFIEENTPDFFKKKSSKRFGEKWSPLL